MKKTILAAMLFATLARADVAIHVNDGECYVYDSTGTAIVEGITRLTFTGRTATWICTADQGFPAGHVIRLDYANTGETCGVVVGSFDRRSTLWRETISASGHITLTCTVPE